MSFVFSTGSAAVSRAPPELLGDPGADCGAEVCGPGPDREDTVGQRWICSG